MKKFIILLFYLLGCTNGLDCLVTLTMTTLQCQNFCLNKYGSSKPFFNQSSSFCMPYVTCSKGLSLNISSNTCFNGTQSALSISSTEIPDVVNGYLNSFGVATCNIGWTSSFYIQVISSSLYRRYYCDIQEVAGQIYPMSNGEYYFNLLDNSLQIIALQNQYGTQSYWDAAGIIVFIGLTLFGIFNVFQCLKEIRKKIKRRFFRKKAKKRLNAY